ncbi:hypothetical protein SK128_003375 [Halocaridina rubra]|uniref:Uncharacterized protein n=1 Tax=Halocaridina rubra TaxID=373956 RepID=A0AAN8WTX0_HALRR
MRYLLFNSNNQIYNWAELDNLKTQSFFRKVALRPSLSTACEQEVFSQLQHDMRKPKKGSLYGTSPRSNWTAKELCDSLSEEESELTVTRNSDIWNYFNDYIKENVVVGHVFFEQSTATLYKRDVITTPSQIVANIGGLLGLFLGFSLLSGVEILFYLFEVILRFILLCCKKAVRLAACMSNGVQA